MTTTLQSPALDRRHFLGLVGVSGMALAGCGAGDARTDDGTATTTVDTALGAVSIPTEPTRVIAMYSNDVDLALVLGLPLVGASTANGAGAPEGFAAHQSAAALDGVEALQTHPEADYEAVAALSRSITDSPLWASLPAVAAGRVVLLPSELNFPSPLTAPAVLARLHDAL